MRNAWETLRVQLAKKESDIRLTLDHAKGTHGRGSVSFPPHRKQDVYLVTAEGGAGRGSVLEMLASRAQRLIDSREG